MNAVSQIGSPTSSKDNFQLRKGIDGYIVSHSWSTERPLTKEQIDKGYYPQQDYHNEEFAYTTKDEAIAKLSEIVG